MSGKDPAIRLVETARLLPIGHWRTTAQVHAALVELGYDVCRRTVQRDLVKLARPFGIDLRGTVQTGFEWRRTRSLEEVNRRPAGTMLDPIPATPEILEALRPAPVGIGLRIKVES